MVFQMLELTRRQMAVFRDVHLRKFQDEVIDHLQQSFGSTMETLKLDDFRLRSIIDGAIEQAGKYGIVSRYEVTRFIEYSFEYGEHFDSLPWFRPVLIAEELTGEEKMDRLDGLTVFALR